MRLLLAFVPALVACSNPCPDDQDPPEARSGSYAALAGFNQGYEARLDVDRAAGLVRVTRRVGGKTIVDTYRITGSHKEIY